MADNIDKPQFATAIGLMLIDSEANEVSKNNDAPSSRSVLSHGTGIISKFLGRFKA